MIRDLLDRLGAWFLIRVLGLPPGENREDS